jgi:signal transduction histidine kinase
VFGLFSTDANGTTMAAPIRTDIVVSIFLVLLAALVPPLHLRHAAAAEAEVLTTAAAIARSVVAETDEPPPVRLEAVVTHRDTDGTIFLEDATGSTFILRATTNPRFPRGERVRVEGVVYRGLFINGILPSRIEPFGPGARLEPRPIAPQIMATGSLHYALVSLEGVGRGWRPMGKDTAMLLVNVAGSVVEARFERAPADEERGAWIGARLRLDGIAAGEINDRRQLIRPYLLVADRRDVTVLAPAPADPFALPETAFSALGRGELHEGLQLVSGIASSPPRNGRLFLTTGDKGLCALLDAATANAAASIRVGDRIEAVGFADAGPFAARLAEAHVRVTATGEAVGPLRPSVQELREGCDAQCIQVEMPVIEREDRAGGTLLVADLEGLTMQVIAPGTLAAGIVPAATIRVTAPCLVTSTRDVAYRLKAAGYALYPVTSDDVVLLAKPSWWTGRRLALALAASLAAGAVGLAWVVLLRRQVRRQLALIEEKIQSEAIAEERRRIAREFHDSLEQDLAGLALRIDSAAGSTADTEVRSMMERQRQILARLQDETRQYVWDLREPARLRGSLADRAEVMLADLRELTSTPIELSSTGPLPEFPPETTHHLLRILRESVNNAAHHAHAGRITVTLGAEAGSFTATVTDDGDGFDMANDGGPAGHFGLRGLAERARRIGADVAVQSRPDAGTTVTMRLPVPPRATAMAPEGLAQVPMGDGVQPSP